MKESLQPAADTAREWGSWLWERTRFTIGSLLVLLVLGMFTWIDWQAANTGKRMQWVATTNRPIEEGTQIDAADVTIGFRREKDTQQRRARPDKVVGSYAYERLDVDKPVDHGQVDSKPPLKPKTGEILVAVTVTEPSARVLRPGMYVMLRKGKEKEPARVVHVDHKVDSPTTPPLVVVALSSMLEDLEGWAVAITTQSPGPPSKTP